MLFIFMKSDPSLRGIIRMTEHRKSGTEKDREKEGDRERHRNRTGGGEKKEKRKRERQKDRRTASETEKGSRWKEGRGASTCNTRLNAP